MNSAVFYLKEGIGKESILSLSKRRKWCYDLLLLNLIWKCASVPACIAYGESQLEGVQSSGQTDHSIKYNDHKGLEFSAAQNFLQSFVVILVGSSICWEVGQ